jgi:nicotinamidase-related amidase
MKYIFIAVTIICLSVLTVRSQQNLKSQNMNKALIIIDIQNDYFENGKMPLIGPVEASLNAKLILEQFRKEKQQVFHIQHISVRPNSTFLLPVTKGQEIHENVRPIEGEKVIVKHFPNGFRETELLEDLKSKKITDLVICGMMTHMCVDATVRAAKDYGFNCTLIGDACATRDLKLNGAIVKSEDVHSSFLAALGSFYAQVITTKEYLGEK